MNAPAAPAAPTVPTAPRPLEGVRVLDLSRVFAGPVAGRVLSDLGAEVVKVEPPEGDVTRIWGRKTAGLSTYFTQQNCGKRNVCVDLRKPGGPELVADLAAVSDIVIENFRPGVLTRYGLDWPALSARNPRLVMMSISGFGQDGPESQRAAYASVIHAETGLIEQHEGVHPLDLSFSAADVLSGMHGVIGVMAALRVRDQTGIGQYIDIAMMDAMAFSSDMIIFSIDDSEAEKINGEVWNTACGPVNLAGGLRWVWHQLSAVHGLVDPSPKDADLATKMADRRACATAFLCGLPDRAAVLKALDDAGLAWGELRERRQVMESPTLTARKTVVRVDDRAGGDREVVRSPYRMSASDTSAVGVAAHRGEHNAEVLSQWLGRSSDEVDALLNDGVLLQDEWVATAAGGTR